MLGILNEETRHNWGIAEGQRTDGETTMRRKGEMPSNVCGTQWSENLEVMLAEGFLRCGSYVTCEVLCRCAQ